MQPQMPANISPEQIFSEVTKHIAVTAETLVDQAIEKGLSHEDMLRNIEELDTNAPDFSQEFESLVNTLGAGDANDPALQAIAFDAIRRAMDGGVNANVASKNALIMVVNQVYSKKDQSLADLHTKEANEVTEGHVNQAAQDPNNRDSHQVESEETDKPKRASFVEKLEEEKCKPCSKQLAV